MVTILDKTSAPAEGKQSDVDLSVTPKARPVLDRISVNGVAIAEADILAETQNHPAETPGEALLEAARALVVRSLLLQEAHRLGLDGSLSEDDDGRFLTPEDAAIQALVEREVDVPTATDDECRRYFNLHPERFRGMLVVGRIGDNGCVRNELRSDLDRRVLPGDHGVSHVRILLSRSIFPYGAKRRPGARPRIVRHLSCSGVAWPHPGTRVCERAREFG